MKRRASLLLVLAAILLANALSMLLSKALPAWASAAVGDASSPANAALPRPEDQWTFNWTPSKIPTNPNSHPLRAGEVSRWTNEPLSKPISSARAEDLNWTFDWTPSNIPSNLSLINPTSSTKLSHLCLTNAPFTRPPVHVLGVEIPEAFSAPARQWHSAWEDGIQSLKRVFAQD